MLSVTDEAQARLRVWKRGLKEEIKITTNSSPPALATPTNTSITPPGAKAWHKPKPAKAALVQAIGLMLRSWMLNRNAPSVELANSNRKQLL